MNKLISIISLRSRISIISSLSLLLFAFIIPKIGISQDIHYSQFFNSPLNLNPALTAYTQADFRMVLNNRSQWASVTVPYKTFSGSFDFKILNRKKSRDYFGAGIIFNKDEAGDSHYGTTQIGISTSWIKSISRRNHHIIAIGLQSSYYQRSIDYTELYFQEQWDGNQSQISNGNSENFAISNYSFFDIGAGIHYLYSPNKRLKANSGISVAHINQPQQSLMNNKEAKLNAKFQVYSEFEISLNTIFDIIPSVYYSQQGPYQELMFGTKFYYKIHKTRKRFMAISTGIYGRNKDALILYTGIDYKSVRLSISYDINLSPLKAASQYRGGMELGLKWFIFKREKAPSIEATPCPIF